MVTNITNKQKYEALFKKAWEELAMRNKFTSEELEYYGAVENTFTSLEDYFTKINTMIAIEENEKYADTYKYWDYTDTNSIVTVDNPKKGQTVAIDYELIMLPLEEPRLEINADTREINIPVGFKKLVGVQGDHIAETLIFSIDRFFDFIDLWNTEIYVQWVNENGADMLTPIEMKCYEASTQKILFGWPISDKITKAARTLNFSVRFLEKDNDKINYSLNTKVHQITIAPALRAELGQDIISENVSDYFLNAIKNSPSTDAPPAAVPYFAAPGLDLNAEADLNSVTNTYVLKVQAVKDGLGTIVYDNWTYLDANNNAHYYPGEYTFEPTEYDANDNITKYYKQDPTDSSKYISWDPSEDAEVPAILYEKYYTYTVSKNSEDSIVGQYWVNAQNKTANNISKKVACTACEFPGPESIEYAADGDLPANAFIEDGSTYLKVTIETSNKNKSDYKWFQSTTSSNKNEITTPIGGSAEDLLITTPGWYYVNSIASRNGDSITVDSNICRVINHAEPVEVESLEPVAGVYNIGGLEDIALTVNLKSWAEPQELYSDNVTYKWFAWLPDQDPEEITLDNYHNKYRVLEGSSINGNVLHVVGHDGNVACGYKCRITNILNGEASDFIEVDGWTIL